MSVRPRWLASISLVFALLACAEGAPSMPPEQPPALPAPIETECGNDVREGNEICDCPETATIMCAAPDGVDCASLGMGTGMVYCDPQRCNYITMFCSNATSGGGGMGGAGTGG